MNEHDTFDVAVADRPFVSLVPGQAVGRIRVSSPDDSDFMRELFTFVREAGRGLESVSGQNNRNRSAKRPD